MQCCRISTWLRAFSLIIAVAGLSACGGSGSGSSSDYTNAYLQFYNASPNGATVLMREVDGDSLGSASFGDTSSLISLDSGDLELEFYRVDSDDQEVIIDTFTVDLSKGKKTLIVLSGDFSAPTFNTYVFERETLDSHFRMFAVNTLVDGQSLDLYMSESGDPFEAAHFLGTIDSQSLSELTYWDGDDDSDDFDTGKYTLYLTEPGETEVVFESQTINFAYDTEYVLAIRDVSGAIQEGMSIDMILNSTSVTNLTDVDADSQYRVYNSTNLDSPVTITFGGNAGEEDTVLELAAGEISDFTPIFYGDYRITATTEDESTTSLKNKVITLNQGESKAIIIYNKDNVLGAATFVESGESQAYDKTVNFVNLVSDFDDVDFYLVRSDETIDTADYYVLNTEFGENKTKVLPSDYYEVIAVYEDDNEEQVLLDRTEMFGFTENANYIVTVEPADTATGYRISILN